MVKFPWPQCSIYKDACIVLSLVRASNYGPLMKSRKLLKLFERLILLHLEKYLILSPNQFAYRTFTGCLDALNFLKYTISHYNQRQSDMFCPMTDLSQTYDQVNINTLYSPWTVRKYFRYYCLRWTAELILVYRKWNETRKHNAWNYTKLL